MAWQEYISKIKAAKTIINIFLSNGIMLEGKIKEFDNDSILLDTDCLVNRDHLISIKPK